MAATRRGGRGARPRRAAEPVLQRGDHRGEALSPRVVLFDLDGTLSASERGILSSLRASFAAHGLAPLTAEQERGLLGPPFADALPPYVGAHRLDSVIATYREHYGAVGMFDTSCYEGIPSVLDELRARGVRLAVATSKPEPYAVPIVEALGLTSFFDTVAGDTLAGERGSKALVITEALQRMGNPASESVLMVGDRIHDVEGARAHGIATLGAGWGYGTAQELADCSAVYATPLELLSALQSGEVDAFLV